ncbi:MAG TPA: elongation factor P maturation arginine rhamnosyltransferase EarP [Rubrivivax sp.]|nr:elongation factor P maturation arginine rhamnosyltransferase EarP [Rubrivivax sp.]HRY86422.1 elongation factor P maturation arginine rhamnosyltransferase EarP [Rubrivivax sp.]HRZ61999.1 elongation factor P maturation arginine rhamnosyltransferase EarP [Rubrivivax sp.]
MRWDLFCRVVDNYGDIGVCWRLAADLGARGEQLRLWVDDPSALAWMAPDGAAGVQVVRWTTPAADLEPGDVVVEAFGCDPPPAFVARMAARAAPPVWINLEYLSAEAWVARCHGLPSPQPGGLIKWFYYPGFDDATGGLIREPGLAAAQQAFDAAAWLHARGWAPRPGERCASLFCYDTAPVAALLPLLARQPTLLLLTPGPAQRLAHAVAPLPGLRCVDLPWLAQPDYDRLLWACGLNFVRGEDSFVRAIWAGRPFVWQPYPQHDGAHHAKLEAFMARWLAAAPAALAAALRALWQGWSGAGALPAAWPDAQAWADHARAWPQTLRAQTDLGTRLLGFVQGKR